MWKAVSGEKLFERYQESIVAFNLAADLAKARRVFDFLPTILKTPGDEKILRTWVDFFRLKRVPFIVVEENGIRTLWKEEYVSWRK